MSEVKSCARVRSPILAVTLALLLSPPAMGETYSFTKIADDDGPFSLFISPTINDMGTVAFFAFVSLGHGVFVSNGGPITTIADDSILSEDTKGFGPAITDTGLVYFHTSLDTGVGGIHVGTGGRIETIIDGSGEFLVFSDPSVNDAGELAFHAQLDAGIPDRGIFRLRGDVVTTIADNSETFCCFGVPTMNNAGMVAFQAFLTSPGNAGIFVGDGGELTTIADTNGPLSAFSSVYAPSIDDDGMVAFTAGLDTGAEGIFIGDGGPIVTITDTNGPFSSFDGPVTNNQGTIVFRAELDAGGSGIFNGPDHVNDAVIKTDDILFGAQVTNLLFSRGLNDRGDIVFQYQLATGVRGLAVAQRNASPDLDGDGVVGPADLPLLLGSWGKCEGCDADLTGDLTVGPADLALLLGAWGPVR